MEVLDRMSELQTFPEKWMHRKKQRELGTGGRTMGRLIDADILKKYMVDTGRDVERFLGYIDERIIRLEEKIRKYEKENGL